MLTRLAIRSAYLDACRGEIDALKPGNVHRYGEGHGMTAEHFLRSAEISADVMTATGATVGERVLGAIEATREAVGLNTNLGIVLLCAPLAAAAERPGPDLKANVDAVLCGLDRADADRAFRAIVLAKPGGLGESASNDVRAPAMITLREAMTQAADRDLIARQYAAGFEDVFGRGFEALADSAAAGLRGMWPTVRVFMGFLAGVPDSHIARKHGPAQAASVQAEAAAIVAGLWRQDVRRRIEKLLDFDERLKQRGLNPGTCADLTVATLMAYTLRSQLASSPG